MTLGGGQLEVAPPSARGQAAGPRGRLGDPGHDGGAPGGRKKFRVVVAVVARPGPGPG